MRTDDQPSGPGAAAPYRFAEQHTPPEPVTTFSAKCRCIQARWSCRLRMMRSVSQLGNTCCSTWVCISRGSTS